MKARVEIATEPAWAQVGRLDVDHVLLEVGPVAVVLDFFEVRHLAAGLIDQIDIANCGDDGQPVRFKPIETD